MSMTDPIADFLTRLRNAAGAQHHDVTIPSSKLKSEVARILKEQGYIDGYEVRPAVDRPGDELNVILKYTDERKPVISGIIQSQMMKLISVSESFSQASLPLVASTT